MLEWQELKSRKFAGRLEIWQSGEWLAPPYRQGADAAAVTQRGGDTGLYLFIHGIDEWVQKHGDSIDFGELRRRLDITTRRRNEANAALRAR